MDSLHALSVARFIHLQTVIEKKKRKVNECIRDETFIESFDSHQIKERERKNRKDVYDLGGGLKKKKN